MLLVVTVAPEVVRLTCEPLRLSVASHEAWGLGVYSNFLNRGIVLDRAIEVPNNPGVKFHDMITVFLDNYGGISNVINNTGGATKGCPPAGAPKVTTFP